MNEQYVNWIRQQLNGGVSAQQIAQYLSQQNLSFPQISTLLTEAMRPQQPTQQPPMQQMGMQQPPMQQMGMQQPPMQQMGMQQPPMQQMGMQQPPMQQMGMQPQGSGDRAISQIKMDRYAAALAGARDGNASGRKLPSGVHLVRIVSVVAASTFFGDRFIPSFVVLESTNSSTEIGGTYSDPMAFDDQYSYGLNDIKSWLCQIVAQKLNTNAKVNWDPRYLTWSFSEQQPCAGSIWRVETHERPSKKTDNVKMIHEWSILPPDTQSIGLTAHHHQQQQAQPQIGLPQGMQGAAAPHISDMLARLGQPQPQPQQQQQPGGFPGGFPGAPQQPQQPGGFPGGFPGAPQQPQQPGGFPGGFPGVPPGFGQAPS